MMIEYEPLHREAALHLFSYLPTARKGGSVQQMLSAYERTPERRLYLWEENEKMVGVIGIHIQKQTFAVQHISVHPSFRNHGIGSALIQAVQEEYVSQAMCSTQETKDFLDRCWHKHSQFS